MTRESSKPTILIVPGSFSPAHFYSPVVNGLNASGFETFVYDLPSASRKPPEHAATLAEDAMFFNGVLTSLCDAEKNVVVLGHSYGGSVISECVKGLMAKRDGKGRVVGLIYLTALVPLVGQSLAEMSAHLGFDFIKADVSLTEHPFVLDGNTNSRQGDFLYHEPLENSVRTNFSDLPQEKGLEFVKQMPYHSGPSFQQPLRYAGYSDVDRIAYISCSQDKCLPPGFQRQQIENAKSGGKPVEVYHLDSGHCPNASQPEKVVEVIKEAMEKQFM